MNFAELRFWECLFSGLAVILGVRYLCAHLARSALAVFDKVALFSLGLFLLLCVSWVTFLIFLVVAITTYVGLAWILKVPCEARLQIPLCVDSTASLTAGVLQVRRLCCKPGDGAHVDASAIS